MRENRTIAVVGATGMQGGALARSILDDTGGGFQVRALTRKPDSEPARALSSRGAVVVKADLDDVEDLKRAFDGCWGAYCLTNFWEHFSVEREIQQVRNMAAAARDAGLQHVVWSTLEDTRETVPLDDDRMPTLQGKYKVPPFDGKGEANAIWAENGVPTTFYFTTFYWENLLYAGSGPQRGEDGRLTLALPMGEARLAGIAVEDIGRCAHGLFRRGQTLVGERIGVAGEHLTGREMATALGKPLGEPVDYRPVPHAAYRGQGFPGADDLGNMFQYFTEFEEAYCRSRSVDVARDLNPDLMSFGDWLTANAARIPIA
jgi:uncharacterized protein YbjT (DUF2867 family)